MSDKSPQESRHEALETFLEDRAMMGRLMALAISYSRRNGFGTDILSEDLIQETAARILEGRRDWARGPEAVKQFRLIMMSIANEWQEQDRNKGMRVDHTRAVPLGEEGLAGPGNAVLWRSIYNQVLRLFDDKPVAKSFVEGRVRGDTAQEQQEQLGLTDQECDATRKLMMRRLVSLRKDLD